MAAALHDVVAVGSAIVDVLASVDEAVLIRHQLAKGTMTLIDLDRADELYASMGSKIEVSGGSAANTAAGVASLGGSAGFIGKVRDDELGLVFANDIRGTGVAYPTPAASQGPATARCLVFVTHDAQRTMCTYLGAAALVSAADIDEELVGQAAVTYLEGYLWDAPEPIGALRRAVEVARSGGKRVAFTLSDPFCVERHRADFLALIDAGDIDVLFANEAEAISLVEAPTIEDAVAALAGRCEIVVVTRGPLGSVVLAADVDAPPAVVPAVADLDVVDTTGAGDLFAAGFLYGLTHGRSLEACASLGSRAAAAVITHVGARPREPLSSLVALTVQ